MKWQTAGSKFTHRSKINNFVPQGQLVAQIHVKFVTAKWHVGCGTAWPCKISRQSVPRVGTWPQNDKNFHFGVKSHPAGANPLIDF